jgi:hypothetical protein
METVQVPLSTATLDRIQRYSTRPLLETPEIVLNRILDLVEGKHPPGGKILAIQTERPAPTEYTTSRGVRLPIGLELWASYRSTRPKAEVTAEGFKYKGKTYEDPSAAARAAKLDAGASENASSTNGWVFWMVKASQSPSGKIDPIDVFRRAS